MKWIFRGRRNTFSPSRNSISTTGRNFRPRIERDRSESLFELLAEFLALLLRSITRNADWLGQAHLAPGKRKRNLKTVPALHANLPVETIRDGHNRQPRKLRQ